MKDIVIFGAGGLAKEVILMINDGINHQYPNKYHLLGCVVEKKYYQDNMHVSDYPVLGTEEWLINHKDDICCTIAIGDYPHERGRIFNYLKNHGIALETIISPRAYVPTNCIIGEGSYIGSRVMLSADVEIGEGTFINTDVLIGHDTKIGRFCNIFPRVTISGRCRIEDYVIIGGASYIVPEKRIGTDACVAAGSVVFTNVKANTHVIGNPAKRITL